MSNQRHPDKIAHTYTDSEETKRDLKKLAAIKRTTVAPLIREATAAYIESHQKRIAQPPQYRTLLDDLIVAETEGQLSIDPVLKNPVNYSNKTVKITYTEWRDTLADIRALAAQERDSVSRVISKATFIYLSKHQHLLRPTETKTTKTKTTTNAKTKNRPSVAPKQKPNTAPPAGDKRKPRRFKR
jgi:hypothetical protein